MLCGTDRIRLFCIAEKYRPKNVETELIKDWEDSCVDWNNLCIYHAPISSYRALIAFLHECAHVILQHKITKDSFNKIYHAKKTSEITEQDIEDLAAYLQQEKQAWNYVEKIVIQHHIPKFAWNYVLIKSRENTKRALQALCIIRGWERHKFDHLVEW